MPGSRRLLDRKNWTADTAASALRNPRRTDDVTYARDINGVKPHAITA
jgi:hypothetical protein